MQRTFYIFDNFCVDAIRLRELALNAQFENNVEARFGGYRTAENYESSGTVESLSAITGLALCKSHQGQSFGHFHLMTEDLSESQQIRVDRNSKWTAILFLSKDIFARGGLSFYRHLDTGSEEPTKDNNVANNADHSRILLEQKIKNDVTDITRWEETAYIGLKFNRMVLFRGCDCYHSFTDVFGKSVEDGHLSQVYLLDQKRR